MYGKVFGPFLILNVPTYGICSSVINCFVVILDYFTTWKKQDTNHLVMKHYQECLDVAKNKLCGDQDTWTAFCNHVTILRTRVIICSRRINLACLKSLPEILFPQDWPRLCTTSVPLPIFNISSDNWAPYSDWKSPQVQFELNVRKLMTSLRVTKYDRHVQ